MILKKEENLISDHNTETYEFRKPLLRSWHSLNVEKSDVNIAVVTAEFNESIFRRRPKSSAEMIYLTAHVHIILYAFFEGYVRIYFRPYLKQHSGRSRISVLYTLYCRVGGKNKTKSNNDKARVTAFFPPSRKRCTTRDIIYYTFVI